MRLVRPSRGPGAASSGCRRRLGSTPHLSRNAWAPPKGNQKKLRALTPFSESRLESLALPRKGAPFKSLLLGRWKGGCDGLRRGKSRKTRFNSPAAPVPLMIDCMEKGEPREKIHIYFMLGLHLYTPSIMQLNSLAPSYISRPSARDLPVGIRKRG